MNLEQLKKVKISHTRLVILKSMMQSSKMRIWPSESIVVFITI